MRTSEFRVRSQMKFLHGESWFDDYFYPHPTKEGYRLLECRFIFSFYYTRWVYFHFSREHDGRAFCLRRETALSRFVIDIVKISETTHAFYFWIFIHPFLVLGVVIFHCFFSVCCSSARNHRNLRNSCVGCIKNTFFVNETNVIISQWNIEFIRPKFFHKNIDTMRHFHTR